MAGPRPRSANRLIADAVALARAAGVPEETIRAVLREEADLADAFSVPIAAGRLGVLVHEAGRGRRADDRR